VYEFLDYRVLDVMTADPIGIPPKTSLAEAEQLFETHGFNSLPVVGEDRELLGLVTQLDLLKAFRFDAERMLPSYETIMAGPVEAAMETELETVRFRTPLTRVLERMVRLRRRSLPVVEEGKLVGMVSRRDVLGALRSAVAGERPDGPI
jgi:CBS domain-containing protein